LGLDFDNFASGLRAALRQAPKVVLVGEMRDRETVEIGLTAAETGHLVLASLHTIDAGQTINRISGHVRHRGTGTGAGAIGRHPALDHQPAIGVAGQRGTHRPARDSWAPTSAPRKPCRWARAKGKTFYEIIEASYPFGWRTFDHSAIEAFENGLISEETALAYCTRRSVVSRGIDNVKKRRGEVTGEMVNLRMKVVDEPRKARRCRCRSRSNSSNCP
jgi:twitching motility protein PilT